MSKPPLTLIPLRSKFKKVKSSEFIFQVIRRFVICVLATVVVFSRVLAATQDEVKVPIGLDMIKAGIITKIPGQDLWPREWQKAEVNKIWPSDLSEPTEITISGEGHSFAVRGQDDTVRIFQGFGEAFERRLQLKIVGVQKFAFHENSALAYAIDKTGNLLKWDLAHDEPKSEVVNWADSGKSFALSKNGRLVAGLTEQGPVYFDVQNPTTHFELESVDDIQQMMFSPSRRMLVASFSAEKDRLAIWLLPSGKIVRELELDAPLDDLVSVSAEESSVALRLQNGHFVVYDISSENPRKRFDEIVPLGGKAIVSERHTSVEIYNTNGTLEKTVVERSIASNGSGPRYVTVPVYFGTNRKASSLMRRSFFNFFLSGLAGVVYCLVAAAFVLGLLIRRTAVPKVLAVGAIVLLSMSTARYFADQPKANAPLGYEFGIEHDSGPMNLGKCEVTVPETHEVGRLESPPDYWIFHGADDVESHIVLSSVELFQDKAQFVSAVNDLANKPDNKTGLVFIHGFNVSFRDAIRRTAQLQVDLQIKGPAFCYSWPSHGDFARYSADEANAELSRERLRDFIQLIVNETDLESVNIIAHSMGNRVLGEAFRGLPNSFASADKKIKNVILAAPDIDQRVFVEQIAPAVCEKCSQVTLYASSNDRALSLSGIKHQYQRAGDTRPSVTICDGVLTIDASAIDTSLLGHSYYGDKPWLLQDIFHLLDGMTSPEQRFGLQRTQTSWGTYWVFRRGIN